MVNVGRYRLTVYPSGLPGDYAELSARATLVDQSGHSEQGRWYCLSVECGAETVLVVSRKRRGPFSTPEALVIPETEVLFLGGAGRLLICDLKTPRRLCEHPVSSEFDRMARFEDAVLLAAQREFAAWDIRGAMLWNSLDAIAIEPPWGYAVRNGVVRLEGKSAAMTFPLMEGPRKPA